MAKGKHAMASGITRMRNARGVQTGTRMICCDNSGCKEAMVIGVKGFGGRLNRLPCATVGDVVMATCKKGKPELRKKVVLGVVARQKRPIRRRDGSHWRFQDNALILISVKGDMVATQVNGPVAREVCEMWPKISSQCQAII
ncbi:60S ribosomal protein L23 [Astathelohania contejeani]|uniref:60S ribosomal protein L23 n=1 Tax=Astathelohania contejeani TaxID=164912 RepID=A0ABQ7HYN6_9MICR|nr:60S ribosomal protein L23 [Thelohania contejeani]